MGGWVGDGIYMWVGEGIHREGESRCVRTSILKEFTPFYILHTRALGTYLLGVIYLAKKIIR
jgi:hypothetical protein